MINKLCFYIALINYNVFYSKTKGLKFHFWMSQGKTRYQFEQNDPICGTYLTSKLPKKQVKVAVILKKPHFWVIFLFF